MALGAVYTPRKPNEASKPAEQAPVQATQQQAEVTSVPTEQVANVAAVNPDDLISKVTQFEAEKSPVGKSEDEIDAVLFSDKELRAKLDAITDPALKEQFINMRKSMMRGVNDKFQDMAVLRKEMEALKAQTQKPKFSANSVEELLQNQEFLAEAQKISGKASELSQDDTLSDTAKNEITRLKTELDSIKQVMTQQTSQQAQNEWNKYHETLSQRYRNYDRSRIDAVANELATGKINATPEYLYKAIYHDDNVKRAYEMGRREALSKLEEKKSATSIDGTTAVKNQTVQQDSTEDNKNFLQRIIATRLSGSGANK